jgi:hypothetical protein
MNTTQTHATPMLYVAEDGNWGDATGLILMPATLLYVAEDGNWGDATGLILVPATLENVETLTNSSDGERPQMAAALINQPNQPNQLEGKPHHEHETKTEAQKQRAAAWVAYEAGAITKVQRDRILAATDWTLEA